MESRSGVGGGSNVDMRAVFARDELQEFEERWYTLVGERTTAATRVSESADSAAILDPDYAFLPRRPIVSYNFHLSRGLNSVKFSGGSSHVIWSNGE